MNQRFRRNIAPVLGALALLALGVLAWAGLSIYRTHVETGALHAQFAIGSSPWGFEPPDAGYALFVYRSGDTACATLSLQPALATLILPPMVTRSVDRAESSALVDELASLAEACDTLEVRVFATRMPYHGRFEVRYEANAVLGRTQPSFGG